MFTEELSANEQERFEEIVKVDQAMMRSHVREVVKETVEETLNGLLDAEAVLFPNHLSSRHCLRAHLDSILDYTSEGSRSREPRIT